MKTIWGTLLHLFGTANPVHIVFSAVIYIITIILLVLHKRWKSEKEKLKIWRWLCLSPLLICIVHFMVFCMGEAWKDIFSSYIEIYIPAIIIAFWGLIGRWKYTYPIMAVIAHVSALLIGFYFSTEAPYLGNFANQSYTEAFDSMCDYMDKHYVLADWKEIDFEAIKAELRPEIVEAEQNQDIDAYYAAIEKFVWYMHDGHVWTQPYEGKHAYVPSFLTSYNDYGFCMITLDNGKTIAVNTDPECEAYSLGIHDGTVIISWDGIPIDGAKAKIRCPESIPVASNEELLQPIYLSGTGGDCVDVVFIDDNGREQTVAIKAISDSYMRIAETLYEIKHMQDEGPNYSTRMISAHCGYLRLSVEQYGEFADIKGYLLGDHKDAREMFRMKLRELREQGMTCLVIDLRNNGGGLDEISSALTDLFSTETYLALALGVAKNGSYVRTSDHLVMADGEFSDIEVVVLTNMGCASAGDGASLYLSKLPNVTLAGISDPCGCNQETGGICYLPDGIAVAFPTGLTLDENNVPNIDTAADRISRNPVEVRIPFDEEAAMRIFSGEGDYELEWALEYLEGK